MVPTLPNVNNLNRQVLQQQSFSRLQALNSIFNYVDQTIALHSPPYYSSFTRDKIVSIPNMEFRVYYLEAPLSILSDNPINLVGLNGFHTGVGFQSTDCTQPYEFYFDYIIKEGLSIHGLLPFITHITGQADLTWNNESDILIGTRIDRNYWTSSDYMGTITSAQLLLYQNWLLDTWKPLNMFYSLFGITSNILTPLTYTARPSICDSFCFDSFDKMKELGMCIEYPIVPKITINNFVSTDVTQVPYEQYKTSIIDFYTYVETQLIDLAGIFAAISQLIQQIERTQSPADRIPLYVRLLNDITYIVQVIYLAYQTLNSIYYYGYGAGGNLVYYLIRNYTIQVDYIPNYEFLRSYSAIDTNKIKVEDEWTSSSISTCCQNSINGNGNTHIMLFFILLIFIIIIVVALVAFYIFKQKMVQL